MTKTRILILALCIAIGTTVGWMSNILKPVSVFVSSSLSVVRPSCDYVAKVQEAQQLLVHADVSVDGDKTYIALELLHTRTCALQEVVVIRDGDDMLVVPDGFDIKITERVNGLGWNYWATQYEIREPKNLIVAANAYPLEEYTVIYTPYSDEFNTAAMIQSGRTYLQVLVDQAYRDLRTRRVPSAGVPNTLVADVPYLKPQFISRLVPVEHIDLEEFILDPEWTTNRLFVLIGANRERTGMYTCSKASACGLMQFTSGTYALMRALYPTAGLIPDFEEGARDPLNATKAAILLHDHNLAQLRERLNDAQFSTLTADESLLEEGLSSAYNTGVARTAEVLAAYLAHPDDFEDWIYAKGGTETSRLVAETKGYITKLRYIRDEWEK